jgi:hypothetical protein
VVEIRLPRVAEVFCIVFGMRNNKKLTLNNIYKHIAFSSEEAVSRNLSRKSVCELSRLTKQPPLLLKV